MRTGTPTEKPAAGPGALAATSGQEAISVDEGDGESDGEGDGLALEPAGPPVDEVDGSALAPADWSAGPVAAAPPGSVPAAMGSVAARGLAASP